MEELDDQFLEESLNFSLEDNSSQLNNENNISFDLIENGQSNNACYQITADSVSICYN